MLERPRGRNAGPSCALRAAEPDDSSDARMDEEGRRRHPHVHAVRRRDARDRVQRRLGHRDVACGAKRSGNVNLGGVWVEFHGFSVGPEVMGRFSRVPRAAASLQTQPDELLVDSYGLAKTATLTTLSRGSGVGYSYASQPGTGCGQISESSGCAHAR